MFSNRISGVPKSFIREILKVSSDPSVTSFAGGLPNGDLFPIEHIREATNNVFEKAGPSVMQYSNSEGYRPLREKISDRYREYYGVDISPDNILITNGSQQGLDLLGKVFINEGDGVIIEEPGYLGAIQAFATYMTEFITVPVSDNGMDTDKLKEALKNPKVKFVYTVPNFQNPSGITYTNENRKSVAEIVDKAGIYLVEDDPYSELRFSGSRKKSFSEFIPERTILLGTISKTIVPSFRLGWIAAPDAVMEKLLIAKQAADLHTNYFCQRIVDEFLSDYSFSSHIDKIKAKYGEQKTAMMSAIKKYFPKDVKYTDPEGGMFIWVTLPEGKSSMELFDLAIKRKIAFVPGDPFYVGKKDLNTFRLNYSNSDADSIEKGIRILAECMEELL